MSQILVPAKGNVLYSELHFTRPSILKSSAKEAICQLCKTELREGIELTARHIGGRLVLVCSNHKI